jgi:AraC-like DNA-binding protein
MPDPEHPAPPLRPRPAIIQRCTGHERLAAREKFDRHRHIEGYVAVLLEGGYQESGDSGRFTVAPGNAVLHLDLEAHQNDAAAGGARILNLPLPAHSMATGLYDVADPDLLVRLAERDLAEAAEAFAEVAAKAPERLSDWPDLLAKELRDLRPVRMDAWASGRGLAAQSLSRGFVRAFGMTPSRYRAEARTRRACELIRTTGRGLSEIAGEVGFFDQSHMSHMVWDLTGHSPGRWRRLGRI